MHGGESTLWVPHTELEKARVRQQMERLLETTHFRNSRRYPALFRFIVEETLDGRGEYLKERLLGVNVFGRPSDYDTAADPVVRVTVAEIRKRIAQYYHEQAHENELRIELLPGHYEPEFRLGRDLVRSAAMEAVAVHPQVRSPEVVEPRPAEQAAVAFQPAQSHAVSRPRARRWYGYAAIAIVGLLGSAGSLLWVSTRSDAVDQFWAPLMNTRHEVTLCMPVAGGKYGVAADSKFQFAPLMKNPSGALNMPGPDATTYLALESLGENVVFSDVRALLSISRVLAQHGVDARSRLNTATTLDDLRQGPSVLIGGMDNQWTLRALSHLRYRFGGTDQESYWIEDARDRKPTSWSLDLKTHIPVVTRDYAVIARTHDEATGQVEVVVAGIGMSGTAAAGELLSDPAQMKELRRRVGPGFRNRDFEAVISTDVVNGVAGSPKILTVDVQTP